MDTLFGLTGAHFRHVVTGTQKTYYGNIINTMGEGCTVQYTDFNLIRNIICSNNFFN